jgi:hypothetical protein
MKLLVTVFLLFAILKADIKQDIYHLYQSKKYAEACSKGMRNFQKHRKDTEFVSLYAFSCLQSDYIDRLAVPISMLKHSEEARANAAYLSVILMQKKLLYHAMIDGYDISQFKLPTTDYVLSKVFDLYAADDHGQEKNVYEYLDPTSPKLSYKLYVTQKGHVKKMVIEEYYDTILTHRHIYW